MIDLELEARLCLDQSDLVVSERRIEDGIKSGSIPLLTYRQAAEICGISIGAIQKGFKKGNLKKRHRGHKSGFIVADLEAWRFGMAQDLIDAGQQMMVREAEKFADVDR